ncbi:uncharacterized protein PSFLO_05540 [Pseudozyma flocculosa]|uniref:Telomerase reverse transcriptase n=1 Tax=Pseudozyma flocculosa TaxID=84751 RepID=A0A5C3F6I3_9BASI|nr:uncharacterized protein PSFLO_05540 [Pseudozyma flocculosa]
MTPGNNHNRPRASRCGQTTLQRTQRAAILQGAEVSAGSPTAVGRGIVSRFYPLVLTLSQFTSRAFGIDLFDSTGSQHDGHQPTRSKLSRFLVAIPDQEQAVSLRPDATTATGQGTSSPPERREPALQVVHRAQLSIVRALARDAPPTSRKTNVLTLGYSKPDERSDTFHALAAGQMGLANHFPNTLVTTIITAPEWSYLLDRIGDDHFHRLLSTTAVYAPLLDHEADGSCYVQMCGQPLSEMQELVPPLPVAPQQHTMLAPSLPLKSASRKRKRKGGRVDAIEAGGEQPAVGPSIRPPTKAADVSRPRSLARIASMPSAAPAAPVPSHHASNQDGSKRSQVVRSHSQIAFVRSRIFYARPIRGRKAKVELGLPFVHVFNRSANPSELSKLLRSSQSLRAPSCYPGDPKPDQTFAAKRARHVLKYIFPRQFGLDNVFTTPKDSRVTSQPLNDYTTRETELRSRGPAKTPNRLRQALPLVALMIRRHDKLDYKKLLDRCCPSRLPRRRLTVAEKERIANDLTEQPIPESLPRAASTPNRSGPDRDGVGALLDGLGKRKRPHTTDSGAALSPKATARQEQKPRFAAYAVPATGQVVHFVTTVVRRLVPLDLFGSQHNQGLVLKSISQFVRARRFETSTLHQAMQGLRVTDVDWTLPPGKAARWQRPTASESAKRRELLSEFVYWLFDSLLIPLLRTTFYATETAAYRNRVLYFRQDDWHAISRPLLDKLKTTVFEPLSRSEALAVMSSRKLGYSHIRLLPKETGVRPIVNLRRRSTRRETGTGADLLKRKRESEKLGQSINFILQSAFHILTYEKKRCTATDSLGASVFGPNEIYVQLKRFRQELEKTPGQRLAKGAKRRLYFVKCDVKCAFDSIDQDRLVEIIQDILSEKDGYLIHRFAKVMPSSSSSSAAGASTKRAFVKLAQPDSSQRLFIDLAAELAAALHHVVFVDSVVYRHEERSRILNLLRQHVMGNLVKISGDFYRQKVGIPQGSSLSTMLCSFFYAHLERTKLGFVRERGSLLMRYTDDFLFVTTSKRKAKTFYSVMHDGHEEYGCFIAKEKTLVNFDLRQKDEGGKPLVERCTGRGFPWCGVLLDTSTLAVEPDLERYRNIDMRDTLTVEASRRPGLALIEKLFQSIKSRCHILYTDTALNSQAGVYRSLYSAFVIAALKYEAYLAELKTLGISFAPRFLIHWIGWLGHHAFLRVLTTRHFRDPTRRQRLNDTEAQVVHHLLAATSRPSLAQTARLKLANQAWSKAVRELGWA